MTDSPFDVAINTLRRRKWFGLTAFVVTLSLGLPFAMFLPNVYRGVATVAIDSQDNSSFVHASVPELETRLVTIQQELLSRGRLMDLIARLRLYSAWRTRIPAGALVETLRRDIHIELSRVDRGRPTAIGLKISYIGLDPRSAAAVPNELATLYVEENTRIREQQTGSMAAFLKSQLDSARQAVVVQQNRLDAFKEQRAGELPEQVSINMVTLERLNTRLRLNLDDQARQRDARDHATVAGEPSPADALEAAKRRLAELQIKFTDQHPDVIRTKAEIAEIERERAAKPQPQPALTRDSGTGGGALASLQQEERTLRSEIAAYEQRIANAPEVEQELAAVKRDYDVANESYASLMKRYEEAQLADRLEQSKKAESFRILDAAVVPTTPAAPNRKRLLIMAFFFAVASAAGIMMLTEHLDTSFHTVGELRTFTTVPVLASIPYVHTRATFGGVLKIALCVVLVAGACVAFAGFGYRAARHNTQLVWMLSAPQV